MSLNYKYMHKTNKFAKPDQKLIQRSEEVLKNLKDEKVLGNDFLGWMSLPLNYDQKELEKILKLSREIKEKADVLVVVGIGGSYLGAKAAIEFLASLPHSGKEVIFIGNNISSYELETKLNYLKSKEFYVNVVSKSGTTLEPAIGFRFIKRLLEEKYGEKEAAKRIIATTDPKDGLLRQISVEKGYHILTVPKNVGGRYSVFTAVGLLPISVAGFDILEILKGAKDAQKDFALNNFSKNIALQHALSRFQLYNDGKKVDLFVSNQPQFASYIEWIKQLFGESEGKDFKGLLPVGCIFTTDLHSLGQFIQQGSPILFETVLRVKDEKANLKVFKTHDDLDKLNYLENVSLQEINQKALDGTIKAHLDNENVSIIELEIDEISEYNFGYLSYYFMMVCAISANLLEINAFNQPGVEFYKKNMFKLLGRDK